MSLTGWSKLRKGIRFRLALVYSTLFGLCLSAFAFIMTSQFIESGREDFDSSLINYAIDLSDHLTDDRSFHIVLNVPSSERKKAFPFVLSQTYYTVRNIQGKILLKSHQSFPFSEIPYNASLPLKTDYTHRHLTFSDGSDVYRAVNLKVTNSAGREVILQVATTFNAVLERERNLKLITYVMVPLLIVISSVFAFLIAGNVMRPIKNLMDIANSIAASNLSKRVPELDTEDDVAELSRTLNNLLDRLEKSFKGQENFVANASHQLNTPLAIIKGELDVLESKERTPEEHQKFLKSLREEIERLIDLVKKMLLVSRVESGLAKLVLSPVRLDDLMLTLTSRLQLKAREKKILIRFDIDEDMDPTCLAVNGERQLLDSLFENLLDNAIKYSPEESNVLIHIGTNTDKKTEVAIQDEGNGMRPEDFQELIKGRFRRVDGFGIPGTGIGLPIANRIAEFHGASISYKRIIPRGSSFVVTFHG